MTDRNGTPTTDRTEEVTIADDRVNDTDPVGDVGHDLESALESDVDAAATSFVELEADIRSNGAGSSDDAVRARVVDAERVPRSAVPENYPWDVETDEALSIEVAAGDGRTTIFFAWPGDTPGERLSRLLTLLGVPIDSFADLHGKSLLLTREDGYWVPVIPQSPARGSERGVYGILAGLAFNLGVFVAATTAVGSGPWMFVAFVLTNMVVLPVATAVDAWYLRTRTDWRQGPWFWAVLAFFPGINVVSSLAYLRSRRRARPLVSP